MTAPREVIRIDTSFMRANPEVAAAVANLFYVAGVHVLGVETHNGSDAWTVTQHDTAGWDQAVRDGAVEDSLTRRAQWDADDVKVGGSE